MIIKSIFRRYERWNPVHPTYGAFWGVGVGIGCGIGWGPGFGPEVIGYVGAGCGAGFSVGITLLGLGIGLPANYLLRVPHSGMNAFNRNPFVVAFMVTSKGALDVARARGLLGNQDFSGDNWGNIRFRIPGVLQNPSASFSDYNVESLKDNLHFTKTRRMLLFKAKQICGCVEKVSRRFFPWDGGSEK